MTLLSLLVSKEAEDRGRSRVRGCGSGMIIEAVALAVAAAVEPQGPKTLKLQ